MVMVQAATQVVESTEAQSNVHADLPIEEVQRRLTLSSPLLIKELHDVVLRQSAAEVGRQSRLDAKANALLTAAGLSLTVAFTFGGWLAGHVREAITATPVRGWATVMVYVAAIVLGVLAAHFAVQAHAVATYGTHGEETIFNSAALKASDTDEPEVTKQLYSLGSYHQFMILANLKVLRIQYSTHERKAALIKSGQRYFSYFLVAVALLPFLALAIAWG